MLHNIGIETKKAFKNKYTLWYCIGIVILILLANVAVMAFRIIYGNNEGTYGSNLLEYGTWCFIIPYYSCIFIAAIAVGDSYPNPNIKDGNTSSLNRTQIYLSKLFSGLIVAFVFLFVTFVLFLAITSLFQIKDHPISLYAMGEFLVKTCYAIPLWYAGLSFGMMFLFAFIKRKCAFIGFFVLTLIIPRFIMFFAAEPFRNSVARMIRKYLITQNMSLIPYPADPARSIPLTIAIGLIYGTLATVIGCVVYNKKSKFEENN